MSTYRQVPSMIEVVFCNLLTIVSYNHLIKIGASYIKRKAIDFGLTDDFEKYN